MPYTEFNRGDSSKGSRWESLANQQGKTAGPVWGILIDLVCGLLVVSATGLILCWSLQSRGRLGAAFILLGASAAAAVYFLFVP